VIPQAFYILFGAAFTFLTAVALGRLLFDLLKLRFYRTEGFLLAFFAGSACLSGIVFALAVAQLARAGVFLAVGALAIGLAAWRGLLKDSGEPLPALPRFWKILFGVVFTIYLAAYLTNAMTPERSPDGAAYHLGLVARYLREHGFRRITTNMYANLSQGVEMLYLFAFAFGRHSAAALVHFCFLATLPLAMLSYARRFAFPAAGAAGALLFFLSPVVGMDGTTAYIDVAVAAILFAVFYLLQIWDKERSSAWLVPIGLLAGFGYAAKYTAVLAVFYALGFVGWKLVRARQPVLKPLLIVSACALLMIVPWVAKNWIWLDNPFSPFFNIAFPNPYVHVSLEREWTHYLRTYEVKSPLAIPLEITVGGAALCGLLGPVFLLAPLALFALREQAGRRLLLAALVFGCTYFLNIGTRFLIPVAPFVALAMGLAAVRAKGLAPLLVMTHALVCWPASIKLYAAPAAWRIQKAFPWKQALRVEGEDGFLTRSFPNYPPMRLIDDRVPPGERVLAMNSVAEAYTSRDILVAYQSAFNEVTRDVLWTPVVEYFRPKREVVFDFGPRKLRAVRVVQTAGERPEHWAINEFYVLEGQQEVKRTPSWKLEAYPNPWDAEMAFDRNAATRWRSWEGLFPGMYFTADFGSTQVVDSVRLLCAAGQYDMRMRVDGQLESGRWVILNSTPEQSMVDDPPALRRDAVAAIRARGVQWVLIYDSDYGAEDLKNKSREWGVTFVGERHGGRLYRLY
jgi:hypothetical protein